MTQKRHGSAAVQNLAETRTGLESGEAFGLRRSCVAFRHKKGLQILPECRSRPSHPANKTNWADFKVFVTIINGQMPRFVTALPFLLIIFVAAMAGATPANKAAFVKYYGQFLPTNLNSCTTCHLPSKLDHPPEDLDEFPHNEYGKRLRALGKELSAAGKAKDMASRLALIAREDADNDGVLNEVEVLLGHNPGDAKDKPARQELSSLKDRQKKFGMFLKKYRWEPFLPVKQPTVPEVTVEAASRGDVPGRRAEMLRSERKIPRHP